jgi:hypothetical protein
MTSPIESALQTILAADYGLNEGDHLRLCNLLKTTFDASKKTGKIESERVSSPKDIEIEFIYANGCKYTIFSETTIRYVQNGQGPSGYIGSEFLTHVRCVEKDNSIRTFIIPQGVRYAIIEILKMHQEMGYMVITRNRIKSTKRYDQFIKERSKIDILEKKAREKYGPLDDGMDEHDSAMWRGDYCYMRFMQHIADLLG